MAAAHGLAVGDVASGRRNGPDAPGGYRRVVLHTDGERNAGLPGGYDDVLGVEVEFFLIGIGGDVFCHVVQEDGEVLGCTALAGDGSHGGLVAVALADECVGEGQRQRGPVIVLYAHSTFCRSVACCRSREGDGGVHHGLGIVNDLRGGRCRGLSGGYGDAAHVGIETPGIVVGDGHLQVGLLRLADGGCQHHLITLAVERLVGGESQLIAFVVLHIDRHRGIGIFVARNCQSRAVFRIHLEVVGGRDVETRAGALRLDGDGLRQGEHLLAVAVGLGNVERLAHRPVAASCQRHLLSVAFLQQYAVAAQEEPLRQFLGIAAHSGVVALVGNELVGTLQSH